MRLSAAATPAAWRSPEASPATNSTLRMVERVSDQRRKCSLDFPDDAERDAQRHPPFVASHDDWPLCPKRRDKALQLELQRLAVRRVELDAIDDERRGCRPVPNGSRAGRCRSEVGRIPRSRGQIEREIAALLKILIFRFRSREMRLDVMLATAPESNVTRALAMSSIGVSTGTPTAEMSRASEPTSVSSRSMSWIIKSSTTATSDPLGLNGASRSLSMNLGLLTCGSAARTARLNRSI